MKYRVHHSSGPAAPPHSGAPAVSVDSQSPKEPVWHDTPEAADVWLLENLRTGRLRGRYHAYVAAPYDDAGNPIEAVDPSDRQTAAVDAQHLANESQEVRLAVGTLLAARQLNAAAVRQLERMLETITVPDANGGERASHPLTIEVLIQAAAGKAAEPFSLLHLFDGLTGTIVPWFRTIAEADAKQDMNDRVRIRSEAEQARLATKVPCLIPFDVGGDPRLARGSSLVLVGCGPAVGIVLDELIKSLLTAHDNDHPNHVFAALHLSGQDVVRPSPHDRYVRVGRKHWYACATNGVTINRFVHDRLTPQMSIAPDLLVVDDLAAAVKGVTLPGADPMTGGLAPFRAADAHRKLHDWCQRAGLALVAGIPAPADSRVDLNAKEWERLRAHATLRPVSVLYNQSDVPDGQARIVVGRLDAPLFTLEVDEALLKEPSRIITEA